MKLTKTDLKTAPGDVVAIINDVSTVVGLATPLLSKLFDQINEWINSLGAKNPNSPKNVRIRLAALEAKDALQKELNKRTNERLDALEGKA